jgi:MOSC domain-containing protein YiiM
MSQLIGEQQTAFKGRLEAIFLHGAARMPMQATDVAKIVAGGGIVGDRYDQTGAKNPKPACEVTLIESEAIEAAIKDYDLDFEPIHSRRNLLTRGVPLNHLVGREFTVGQVVLRGILLCEPCGHLEKLTVQGIERALRHRGGLRAEVLRGGAIRIGDVISIH